MNRVLYIRNLPYKITSDEMYDIFGKYGAIRQIRVWVYQCFMQFYMLRFRSHEQITVKRREFVYKRMNFGLRMQSFRLQMNPIHLNFTSPQTLNFNSISFSVTLQWKYTRDSRNCICCLWGYIRCKKCLRSFVGL